MNEHAQEPLPEEGFLLTKFEYEELDIVRDTLMMLAQFAGPPHTPREQFINLVIPRAFLGQYFADLAHRMGEVLEMVARTEIRVSDAKAESAPPNPPTFTRR